MLHSPKYHWHQMYSWNRQESLDAALEDVDAGYMNQHLLQGCGVSSGYLVVVLLNV